MKQRLDQALVTRGVVDSRSSAQNWVRLGQVRVNGVKVTKTAHMVDEADVLELVSTQQYVSRAGLKLASVVRVLGVDFAGKTVLDVGSSTGGFTDYALQHGATKVYAVDVGTDQLHPRLRGDERIELHEKTDIRSFRPATTPDIVVIDVSFISLREILPYIASISSPKTQVVAMLKPQFEAGKQQTNKGVIKNDAVRRRIIKDFEIWTKRYYLIAAKADSDVAGAKGNQERFYLLSPIA